MRFTKVYFFKLTGRNRQSEKKKNKQSNAGCIHIQALDCFHYFITTIFCCPLVLSLPEGVQRKPPVSTVSVPLG